MVVITRQINIFKGLQKHLVTYYINILKTKNQSVVYTLTPKAGLLGMMAAFATRESAMYEFIIS